MESGIIAVHSEDTTITQMLESIQQQFSVKAREKNITLSLCDTDLHVLCDPKWTVEALGNIVDNAIKYTACGGNVQVKAEQNSFFVKIDIIDDGDDFYTKPDFMNRLKDNNKLNVNFSTEILSAGWYKGKNFWSFNIGLRTDIGANLTKNMFTFLNEMETVEENWRNSNYDISGQQLNINAYTEIGLGLSRQINSRLTVGARVKALLGIGNMELKLNRVAMSANLPSDQQINQWSSESYWNSMTPSQAAQAAQELKDKFNNYHANLTVGAELKSSFKGLELQEEEGKDYVTDFDFDSGKLGIAGYGFGIDLGASYKILDNLTVSASVLDLGFISWSKSSTKIASANPDPIDIKGSTYANMVDPNNPNTVMNAVNQLQNDAQG